MKHYVYLLVLEFTRTAAWRSSPTIRVTVSRRLTWHSPMTANVWSATPPRTNWRQIRRTLCSTPNGWSAANGRTQLYNTMWNSSHSPSSRRTVNLTSRSRLARVKRYSRPRRSQLWYWARWKKPPRHISARKSLTRSSLCRLISMMLKDRYGIDHIIWIRLFISWRKHKVPFQVFSGIILHLKNKKILIELVRTQGISLKKSSFW